MKPVRGISIMKQAISERQAAINRAGTLPTATIPDGQPLLRDLLLALRHPAQQTAALSAGCRTSPTAAHAHQLPQQTARTRYYRASKRATTAKKKFVKMDPLARKFGQPTLPQRI
jgi:hypothetical protein